jgi:hypothetical protein
VLRVQLTLVVLAGTGSNPFGAMGLEQGGQLLYEISSLIEEHFFGLAFRTILGPFCLLRALFRTGRTWRVILAEVRLKT